VENVATALAMVPALVGCFAYDEFSLTLMLLKPLPGGPSFNEPRAATDADITQLQRHLQRHCGMSRVGRDACQRGAESVGHANGYHPIRRYLETLQWDGMPRLDTWLCTCFGAPDDEYTRLVGRMWPIAMVARVYEPGCQCDYMPVLEGKQGLMKSTALRMLAGDAWFSDQPLDLKNDLRAANQHLPGNWIIEIGELQSFKGTTLETIKTFITQRVSRYLRRHAHNESREPRQCLFVGTTNESVYLYDATGNRRFWPVLVTVIDLAAIRAIRDQLFAEAIDRYRTGEHWWPDRETEERLFKPEQDARHDDDSWTQFIVPYLEGLRAAILPAQKAWDAYWPAQPAPLRPERPVAKTTTGNVYRKALADPCNPFQPELAPVSFDRKAQLKVREILIRAGWQVTAKSNGSWWWEYHS
jgi:predicted P-loop ATPase